MELFFFRLSQFNFDENPMNCRFSEQREKRAKGSAVKEIVNRRKFHCIKFTSSSTWVKLETGKPLLRLLWNFVVGRESKYLATWKTNHFRSDFFLGREIPFAFEIVWVAKIHLRTYFLFIPQSTVNVCKFFYLMLLTWWNSYFMLPSYLHNIQRIHTHFFPTSQHKKLSE